MWFKRTELTSGAYQLSSAWLVTETRDSFLRQMIQFVIRLGGNTK